MKIFIFFLFYFLLNYNVQAEDITIIELHNQSIDQWLLDDEDTNVLLPSASIDLEQDVDDKSKSNNFVE